MSDLIGALYIVQLMKDGGVCHGVSGGSVDPVIGPPLTEGLVTTKGEIYTKFTGHFNSVCLEMMKDLHADE